jgi:hypothetical protein
VPAGFHHAAALEDDDHVGAPNRRQAVRDDKRRPIQHQVGKRRLHEQLGFGVERGRCLVEDENRRAFFSNARAIASRCR